MALSKRSSPLDQFKDLNQIQINASLQYGFSRKEMLGLNADQIIALVNHRQRGLTHDDLVDALFFSTPTYNHALNCLVGRVSAPLYSPKEALTCLERLSALELDAVAKGYLPQQVAGLNEIQINLLLEFGDNLAEGKLSADVVLRTYPKSQLSMYAQLYRTLVYQCGEAPNWSELELFDEIQVQRILDGMSMQDIQKATREKMQEAQRSAVVQFAIFGVTAEVMQSEGWVDWFSAGHLVALIHHVQRNHYRPLDIEKLTEALQELSAQQLKLLEKYSQPVPVLDDKISPDFIMHARWLNTDEALRCLIILCEELRLGAREAERVIKIRAMGRNDLYTELTSSKITKTELTVKLKKEAETRIPAMMLRLFHREGVEVRRSASTSQISSPVV